MQNHENHFSTVRNGAPFLTSRVPVSLVIAASDSGGGAGVQADLRVHTMLGVYAMTAITAVTAQNSRGVAEVFPCDSVLRAQIDMCIDDIVPDAVKIGALGSARNVHTVSRTISAHSLRNVVLDPVVVSTSGTPLIDKEGIRVMIEELLPHVTLLTPNIPELKILAEAADCHCNHSDEDPRSIARRLMAHVGGDFAVLVKGGHALNDTPGAQMADYLIMPGGEEYRFAHPRLDTRNTHGTGCSLSSAIASFLALRESLADAVKSGVEWLHTRMEESATLNITPGHRPCVLPDLSIINRI